MKWWIAFSAVLPILAVTVGLAQAAGKSYESETIMLVESTAADCREKVWKTIREQGLTARATVHIDRVDLYAVSIPYLPKVALLSCENGYFRAEVLESTQLPF